jgi:hypothetical protein
MSCCRRKKLSGDNHSITASRFAAIEGSISESTHSLSLYLPSGPFAQEDQDKTHKKIDINVPDFFFFMAPYHDECLFMNI